MRSEVKLEGCKGNLIFEATSLHSVLQTEYTKIQCWSLLPAFDSCVYFLHPEPFLNEHTQLLFYVSRLWSYVRVRTVCLMDSYLLPLGNISGAAAIHLPIWPLKFFLASVLQKQTLNYGPTSVMRWALAGDGLIHDRACNFILHFWESYYVGVSLSHRPTCCRTMSDTLRGKRRLQSSA